jgi:hypothetical protein
VGALVEAEATVSRTASMVVSAVHEMRTTPSPTGVLSVSLTPSSLGGSQPDRAQGWRVTVADAGWLFQPSSVAVTDPRLPTPEPE